MANTKKKTTNVPDVKESAEVLNDVSVEAQENDKVVEKENVIEPQPLEDEILGDPIDESEFRHAPEKPYHDSEYADDVNEMVDIEKHPGEDAEIGQENAQGDTDVNPAKKPDISVIPSSEPGVIINLSKSAKGKNVRVASHCKVKEDREIRKIDTEVYNTYIAVNCAKNIKR